MLRVGLTGGIACGKSVVGEMFVALGAHLVQADKIAHELMLPGQPVYNEVVKHFGRAILNPDMSVNRAKLAELAFATSSQPSGQTVSRVQELNRIVHPAVIRAQEEWMEEIAQHDRSAVAMVEAALIVEAGTADRFDSLVVVTCSEDQRVTRFAARQKLPPEDARKEVVRRMAAQLPDADKIKIANYVIDNSGTLNHTRQQVEHVWDELRRRAAPEA